LNDTKSALGSTKVLLKDAVSRLDCMENSLVDLDEVVEENLQLAEARFADRERNFQETKMRLGQAEHHILKLNDRFNSLEKDVIAVNESSDLFWRRRNVENSTFINNCVNKNNKVLKM